MDSDSEESNFCVLRSDSDECNDTPSKTNPKDSLSAQPDQTDEVRKYLTDLEAGKRHRWLRDKSIEYNVPPVSWVKIHTEFDSFLQRHASVKLFYDSSRSILTIFPMPYPMHGYSSAWVVGSAALASRDSLDPQTRAKFKVYSEADFKKFNEEWKDSWMRPDVRIIWKEPGTQPRETVVEIGDSQSRNSLLRVKDALLKGTSVVERVILMNFVEDPPYRRPEPEDIDMSRLQNLQEQEVQCLSESGPVRYQGVQWVGTTSVIWEVWDRAASGSEPRQVFKASLVPWDAHTIFPLCTVPSTIAPNVEPFSIPLSEMTLYQIQFQEELIEKAKVRMESYVEDAKRREEQAAQHTTQTDEAADRVRRQNNQRAERAEARARRD